MWFYIHHTPFQLSLQYEYHNFVHVSPWYLNDPPAYQYLVKSISYTRTYSTSVFSLRFTLFSVYTFRFLLTTSKQPSFHVHAHIMETTFLSVLLFCCLLQKFYLTSRGVYVCYIPYERCARPCCVLIRKHRHLGKYIMYTPYIKYIKTLLPHLFISSSFCK